MICAVKQSPRAVNCSDGVIRRKISVPSQRSSFLPPLPVQKPARNSAVSVQKALHVSSLENFGSLGVRKANLIKCEAYEAERSQPIESSIELPQSQVPSEAAKKVKIGSYFALWWALNVVFNIYNKKVLNAYPYPWLTSTLSLAAGSLIMLISWMTKIAEAPKTDFDFWKSLFPVSCTSMICLVDGKRLTKKTKEIEVSYLLRCGF